jgi:hypothetical protein
MCHEWGDQMRVVTVRMVTAGLLVSALMAAAQVPALAAGAARAVAASQCQRVPGLIAADLCVTVQSAVSSIRPGGTASYLVGVSVTGGSAIDVTVSLDAQPGGAAYTSGCPVGDGTGRCWIAALALLGAPSSYQMQAEVPAGTSAAAVTLTATASVPSLTPWTPPTATASVAIVKPVPAKPVAGKPSPSSAPSKPAGTSPGRSPSPQRSPAPRGSSTASTGSVGSTGSTGAAGPSSGLAGSPGFTGAFPPRLTGTSNSIVGAGDASGLFPKISPSATASSAFPPGTAHRAELAAASGLPLAPAGLVIALVIAALGIGLAIPELRRRKRAGGKRAS